MVRSKCDMLDDVGRIARDPLGLPVSVEGNRDRSRSHADQGITSSGQKRKKLLVSWHSAVRAPAGQP
jgi:hypothetical protein